MPVVRDIFGTYTAMANTTAPLQIGREGPEWKQYAGALDEVRLWNVARTAGELQGARTLELSGTEPGLVAYWRFNEGAGMGSADATAGGHTATLFNGVTWMAGGALVP